MTDDRTKPSAPEIFNRSMADAYDEKNHRLAAIADNMHFLVRLVLEGLPARARVLCVGAGTGAEILALAKAYPEWSFVGLDPSGEMLRVCRDRLERAGVFGRCELIQGYVDDAPEGAHFDAAVSLLVAHFVGVEDRIGFYRGIRDRMVPGGLFVSTEISGDLDAEAFPELLVNWARVQALMGATPDSLRALPDVLRKSLSVLSPARTEALLREAGFGLPVPFFQAFLIRGWFATK